MTSPSPISHKDAAACIVAAAAFAAQLSGCSSTTLEEDAAATICPSSITVGERCNDPGNTCSRRDGSCDQTLRCEQGACTQPDCPPTWSRAEASCSPEAVACEIAKNGDVCAWVDEWCFAANNDCQAREAICGSDHLWAVSGISVFDACCHLPSCPPVAPTPGSACDPCWHRDDCELEIERSCGTVSVAVGCDPVSSTWTVDESPCP